VLGADDETGRPGCMFLVGDRRFILRPRGDHSILVGEAYFQHENILKGIEEIGVRST
jgi:hypothetical protein